MSKHKAHEMICQDSVTRSLFAHCLTLVSFLNNVEVCWIGRSVCRPLKRQGKASG